MLLSEIVNKRVVMLSDASELGIIIGAYVHKNTHQSPYLALDNGKQIKVDDVFSFGEVVTILASENDAIALDEYHKITINQEIILVSGERLGKVRDLELNGKKKVGSIEGDKGSVKLKSIVSTSTNIIVANPTYRSLKPRVKEPVKPLSIAPEALNAPSNRTEITTYLNPVNAPSYDFLIGKKVNSEVSDINRSFVLMAGTIITEKIISNAIRAGKLTDLVNKSK